jgi:undecaprenyl diphosphate synthase
MKKIIVGLVSSCIGLTLAWYVYSYWHEKHNSFSKPPTLNHLGIILDGNRRWARKAGLKAWFGHRKGVDPVKMTIKFCLNYKIPYLTLYAFSLENFKRPQEELDFLFNILAKEIASNELNALFKEGVKVTFAGDRHVFPQQLITLINDIESQTKEGKNLNLTILFCYGGQQEILQGIQTIAHLVKKGELSPEDISIKTFKECLWTGNIPDPDLIIRTGGMMRLSNFLAFQSAYSELFFTDLYWPEFTESELIKAINSFAERTRNFGG